MNRVWLWVVIPGIFLIAVGLVGWMAGSTPFWYVLLGVSDLLIGLSLRSRRG